MYFIGGEACRRAIRVIIGMFDVGKVCVPVTLCSLQTMVRICANGVVYTFDTAVSARVVGTRREFVYTQKFVDGCCKLCANLESVV